MSWHTPTSRLHALSIAAVIVAACSTDDASDGTGDTDSSSGADGSSSDATTSSPTTTSASTTTSVDDTSTSEPPLDTSSEGDSSGDTTTSGAGSCVDEFPAIVTDIDETLTTSDAEFLLQLADGNYDPAEREGAAELISAYSSLGYRVLYLTARAESLGAVNTGESARELTERWLVEHGFPTDPETTEVVLSPNLVTGQATRTYKAEALMEQQDAGWRFDYAYGNATTDIEAYADAGIALDRTFIIGPEAGTGGTVAIEGEGWVDHTAMQIPMVPPVCQ